jgi:hypothetical protein
MHKPIMEETNITILKPESQDVRAYRNLFGEFQGVEFRKNYKTVRSLPQASMNATYL